MLCTCLHDPGFLIFILTVKVLVLPSGMKRACAKPFLPWQELQGKILYNGVKFRSIILFANTCLPRSGICKNCKKEKRDLQKTRNF